MKLHLVKQRGEIALEARTVWQGWETLSRFGAHCAGLVAVVPVLAAVALLVRLKLGSPVLFRHQRPGIGDKPLILLKFRTMTDARDPTGELLPDERRITQFGQATVRGQDIASDRQATSRKRTFHIHMLTITEWSTAITNLDRLTFFPSDTGF
jgi:hypothetical protein